MQSNLSDLGEAFQHLSSEILGPGFITADLQHRIPTPPVRFGPLPRFFVTALTLLWFASVTGLRYLFTLSRGRRNHRLGLNHLLSRGRSRPVTPPGLDSAQFRCRIFLRPQYGASPVFIKLVQFCHPTTPNVSNLRGRLADGDHRAGGQSRSQYRPPHPLRDPVLAFLSSRRCHIEGCECLGKVWCFCEVTHSSLYISVQPHPVEGPTLPHRTIRDFGRT